VATLSILQNKVVVRQLGLVFIIPLGFLFLVLLLADWPPDVENLTLNLKFLLIAAGIFLVLLLIAIGLVYGGRYEYEFRLNEKGIGGRPHGRTAKKNAIANFLLLFSGNLTAMGAGALAKTRQVEYAAWHDVDTVVADEKRRTLTLQKGKRPLMVVPVDAAHYEAVLQFAQKKAAATRQRRTRSQAPR
ncbi:MAG: hypothetical protein ACE5FD_15900, partial [Anaerolineae bacterium]